MSAKPHHVFILKVSVCFLSRTGHLVLPTQNHDIVPAKKYLRSRLEI